jgi:hypothetical protein
VVRVRAPREPHRFAGTALARTAIVCEAYQALLLRRWQDVQSALFNLPALQIASTESTGVTARGVSPQKTFGFCLR